MRLEYANMTMSTQRAERAPSTVANPGGGLGPSSAEMSARPNSRASHAKTIVVLSPQTGYLQRSGKAAMFRMKMTTPSTASKTNWDWVN